MLFAIIYNPINQRFFIDPILSMVIDYSQRKKGELSIRDIRPLVLPYTLVFNPSDRKTIYELANLNSSYRYGSCH